MIHERGGACLPKNARILETDEFSSVFRLRPWGRSAHFVLYVRCTGKPARIGIVAGRKSAPRAVSRNLIKRLAREIFRLHRASLFGSDIVLRLYRRLDAQLFQSASSPLLRKSCRYEIETLLTAAIRQQTRH